MCIKETDAMMDIHDFNYLFSLIDKSKVLYSNMDILSYFIRWYKCRYLTGQYCGPTLLKLWDRWYLPSTGAVVTLGYELDQSSVGLHAEKVSFCRYKPNLDYSTKWLCLISFLCR